MPKKKNTVILSCTIPTMLGKQLNLLAQIEERSKSFYVKKALEAVIIDRLEDQLMLNLSEEAYNNYLQSAKDDAAFEYVRQELGLEEEQ